MNSKKTLFISQAAVIAALYTVLVLVFQYSSFGPFQFRVAEALTVLPYFTPAAIPGLAVGCLISNLIFADVLDIIFGSLATLLAAFLSYKLRRVKLLVPVPPILVNALVIPFVLRYAYFETDSIPVLMLSVGAGQFVAAGVIGLVLLFSLDRVKHIIFPE